MQPNQPEPGTDAPAAAPQEAPMAPQPAAPVQQAEPMVQQPAPEMSEGQSASANQPTDDATIQWQAPEYISGEQRTPLWFVGFWGAVVVLMATAALLIRSWTFVILIPVMAAALMIYTHRPARQMTYVVSGKGVYINEQIHALSEFKSFGILQEDSLPTLVLTPIKRFRPTITLHFPSEIGEQLVDFLAARMPMENAKLDVFDKVVRRLHL